ncbi:MAG: hypothetical protein JWO58_2320 [Chitinophagaceae bacterium]|nr:hypothetical protein [Chitinophagaceae bacterium]
MKKLLGICLLLFLSHWACAQKLTLAELKALKADYNPDIVQVKDSVIAYPVTGLIHIDIRSSLMGETIVEVEVWVVDSQGKLVYNNTFAAKNLSVTNFDVDYMRYMRMQGTQIIKRRHLVARHSDKTGDS